MVHVKDDPASDVGFIDTSLFDAIDELFLIIQSCNDWWPVIVKTIHGKYMALPEANYKSAEEVIIFEYKNYSGLMTLESILKELK
jgi:hypothetical protein